jgi:hypothetical protein
VLLASLAAPLLWAQSPTYPPLSSYMMPRDAEVALARSAAPATIADHATIKLLTSSGFTVANAGDNGFVCLVLRGWAAPTFSPTPFRDLVYDPTVRAPICLNPGAVRTVLPYYELRTRLGMEGKTPDQIAEAVQAAYTQGSLPARDAVGFGYMWSADQVLGPGVGHWHPHMMIFSPYADNAMLGNNPFGSPLPFVTDDAGTPFAVVVIPVEDGLAIRTR